MLPCIQPFSQQSRTPTVATDFQIGLYDPAEADIQPFSEKPRTPTVAPLSQIGLCDPVKADLYKSGATVGVRGFCENGCRTLLQQLECGIFGRTAVGTRHHCTGRKGDSAIFCTKKRATWGFARRRKWWTALEKGQDCTMTAAKAPNLWSATELEHEDHGWAGAKHPRSAAEDKRGQQLCS